MLMCMQNPGKVPSSTAGAPPVPSNVHLPSPNSAALGSRPSAPMYPVIDPTASSSSIAPAPATAPSVRSQACHHFTSMMMSINACESCRAGASSTVEHKKCHDVSGTGTRTAVILGAFTLCGKDDGSMKGTGLNSWDVLCRQQLVHQALLVASGEVCLQPQRRPHRGPAQVLRHRSRLGAPHRSRQLRRLGQRPGERTMTKQGSASSAWRLRPLQAFCTGRGTAPVLILRQLALGLYCGVSR